MLSLIIFLPAAAALVLLAVPGRAPRATFTWAWIGVSAADLALVAAAWAGYQPRGGFGWTENTTWIPTAGIRYHIGVDGLSLPLIAMTAVLFLAVAVYSLREARRVKSYVCLFLFLQTVSLGLFAALVLNVFFVFFDLSIVGMYFVIAGWGHGERARAAALKFFLYTFTGSLALLLGFIGLYLAVRPHTFDMVILIAADPLAGRVGDPGRGAAEDGHLRVLPDRDAHAARRVAPVRGRVRRGRGDLGDLRGAGRAGPGQLQADDRLYQRQPHGLHPARGRRGRDSRPRPGPGPVAGGDRGGDPDGQPRPAHRGAVPALRRPVRPGRHLPAGRLLRPGRPHAGLRRGHRGRRVRQPRPARPVRVHRRVPDLHRQPGHRRGGHRDRRGRHLDHRRAVPARAAADLHRPAAPARRAGHPGRLRGPHRHRGSQHRAAARPRGRHRDRAQVPPRRHRAGRPRPDPPGRPVNEDLAPLAPEIILAVSAVAGLLAGSWLPRDRQWLVRAMTAAACLAGLAAAGLAATQPAATDFGTSYVIDVDTSTVRIIVLAAVLLIVCLSAGQVAAHPRETEFYVLLQLPALGTIVLAGAGDLLLLFAGYLLASVPGYALAGFFKDAPGTEAAMKYYLIGALLGVFMLTGITLLYGTGRTTSYPLLRAALAWARSCSSACSAWSAPRPPACSSASLRSSRPPSTAATPGSPPSPSPTPSPRCSTI